MKGVVLAGGTGSRLHPLTKSINKHCLPIYDRPMIYYPIQSLVNAGITDIVLVAGGNHMSQFIDLLGDGSELDCNISYVAQMKPGGIAEAISLVEPFVNSEPICVILGDNIFIDDIKPFVTEFNNNCRMNYYISGDYLPHCHVVCKLVPGSEAIHYGVLSDEVDQLHIKEKPSFPALEPHRQFNCVTGLYMYTPDVFHNIRLLAPSKRGELEVSELNNIYCNTMNISYSTTTQPWFDCGVNINHMLEVSNEIKEILCQ